MDEIENFVCYEKYCVIVLVLAIIIVDMWLLACAEMCSCLLLLLSCQCEFDSREEIPPKNTLAVSVEIPNLQSRAYRWAIFSSKWMTVA